VITALAIGYLGDPTTAPEEIRERDTSERDRRPLREMVFAGCWGETASWVE
jgi:hypothetical protein